MIDDRELTRRAILGFGEMVAALGRWGVGDAAVVRRPDAIGARIHTAANNPWFDAAVVPLDAPPPADDPLLPRCIWTVADAVPGRIEDTGIATPCMGVALDDPVLALDGGALAVGAPPLATIGDLNERAYDESGTFGPLIGALRDDRVRTYGLRDGGAFVCVALTLAVGDDASIQYVATEAAHRRRGLAGQLIRALLADARDEGMRSATLQASPDGLPVYARLGFRHLTPLRGYLRPASDR